MFLVDGACQHDMPTLGAVEAILNPLLGPWVHVKLHTLALGSNWLWVNGCHGSKVCFFGLAWISDVAGLVGRRATPPSGPWPPYHAHVPLELEFDKFLPNFLSFKFFPSTSETRSFINIICYLWSWFAFTFVKCWWSKWVFSDHQQWSVWLSFNRSRC